MSEQLLKHEQWRSLPLGVRHLHNSATQRFNSNNFHLIIKPHNNFVKRPQNPLSLSKKIEIKIEKSYSNLFDVYKSDFKV